MRITKVKEKDKMELANVIHENANRLGPLLREAFKCDPGTAMKKRKGVKREEKKRERKDTVNQFVLIPKNNSKQPLKQS